MIFATFEIQVDKPNTVLPADMYGMIDEVKDRKEYVAYRSLVMNLAKLLIKANNGNQTELNDDYLNEAWEQIFNLETRLVRV